MILFDLFARLLPTSEPFVIAAHQVSVAGGDGVAVDGDEGVGGLALGDFFGELALEFGERFSDRGADQVPVGVFGMAFEFGADAACSLADFGDFGLEFGIADHRLDIAQAFVPFRELFSRERSFIAAPCTSALATLIAPL